MSSASVSPPLASLGGWTVRQPGQKGVLPYGLVRSSLRGRLGRRVGVRESGLPDSGCILAPGHSLSWPTAHSREKGDKKMSRTRLGRAPRLTTPYRRQVLLSDLEPSRGRQTPGPDLERAIFQPHPHRHPHTFVPTASRPPCACRRVLPEPARGSGGPGGGSRADSLALYLALS